MVRKICFQELPGFILEKPLTSSIYRVIVFADMKIQYCDFSLIQSGGDTKDL
ncbi:MAG: hypothetical protein IJN54_05870 [Lachnospiraceae bacterium]|nr:hypothetical protein [Lachnospiraceae bacterium]